MAEHLIEAHFNILTNLTANGLPKGLTQHFRNFSITPEGHIIINNFSQEFREKLREVLFSEDIPYSGIIIN